MTTDADPNRRPRRVEMAAVLVVSGVLGFRAGFVQFPDWQVAVETAQVVARIVRYPSTTPFSVYHAELWTVLHQVLAIFLRVGVSEAALSRALSGVIGMLSYQALASIVFAISRDVLVAVGACGLVVLTRASDFGVLYPILLMGSAHTYGMIGLSVFVLVLGLFGAGAHRSAAFFLGLAPAIHPSLGAWLWVVVAIALAMDARQSRRDLMPAVRSFVAGVGITVLSLIVQLAMRGPVPAIEPGEASRYLAGFVSVWDGHRRPVPVDADGVKLNAIMLLVCGVWLVAFLQDLPRPAARMLRMVFVCSLLSLMLVVVSWIPTDRLPQMLLIGMPGRLLNVGAMIGVPLVFGLVALYRRNTWASLLGFAFTTALIASNRSGIWAAFNRPVSQFAPVMLTAVQSAVLILFILVLRAWNQRRLAGDAGPVTEATPLPILQVSARWITIALLAGVAGWIWTRPPAQLSTIYVDRTNDTALRLAAEGRGLVVTGGDLHLVQLRTRRPVLLDGGGLDGIAYSIAAAPQMARILSDVYGVDYFHPPDEARWTGDVPSNYSRKVWEARTADGWAAIARTYDIADVITPSDWSLNLPVTAQSREFRLYRIPR